MAVSTVTVPVVHLPSYTARIRPNTARYGTETMSPDSVAQTMETTRYVLFLPAHMSTRTTGLPVLFTRSPSFPS